VSIYLAGDFEEIIGTDGTINETALFGEKLHCSGSAAGEPSNAEYFLVISREAASWERRRLAVWSVQLPKWAHFRRIRVRNSIFQTEVSLLGQFSRRAAGAPREKLSSP